MKKEPTTPAALRPLTSNIAFVQNKVVSGKARRGNLEQNSGFISRNDRNHAARMAALG